MVAPWRPRDLPAGRSLAGSFSGSRRSGRPDRRNWCGYGGGGQRARRSGVPGPGSPAPHGGPGGGHLGTAPPPGLVNQPRQGVTISRLLSTLLVQGIHLIYFMGQQTVLASMWPMFLDVNTDSVFQVTPSCSVRVKKENARFLVWTQRCTLTRQVRLKAANNIHFKNNTERR